MEFTLDQQKLIYSAVKYYQTNRVPLNSNQYSVCDEILNGMIEDVKLSAQPPIPPVNGFGLNV
jgi:hypothetical protein